MGEDVRSEREETLAGGLSGVVNAVGDIAPMSDMLRGRVLSSEVVYQDPRYPGTDLH